MMSVAAPKLLRIFDYSLGNSFITNYTLSQITKTFVSLLPTDTAHLLFLKIIDRRRMMARQSVGQEFVILITLLAGVCSAQRHSSGVMGKSKIVILVHFATFWYILIHFGTF